MELYRVGNDPMEWVNLIGDVEHEEIVDALKKWVPDSRAKSSKIHFKKPPNYVDADADSTIKNSRNLNRLK